MIDNILSFVAPHRCCGCNEAGSLLCENCKYDIVNEPFEACAACGTGLAGTYGICGRCTVPYARAWCVADRRDQLERLINDYKFSNAQASHKPLAELLDMRLPELPQNTVIIPVPTVSTHIRQRGYDHMLLIARRFGRSRRLPVSTDLIRVSSTRQRGAGRRQRIEQAKRAFDCRRTLDPGRTYLLLDDVVTTGATVQYAAQALRDAGATTVWVSSISRQPVD